VLHSNNSRPAALEREQARRCNCEPC